MKLQCNGEWVGLREKKKFSALFISFSPFRDLRVSTTTTTTTKNLILIFFSLSLSNTHTRMLMKSMEDILMDHPTSLTQDRVLYKKLALGDDPAAPPAPPSKKNINSNKIVVSPDHLLMVQYTTFVKKTLHVGKFAEQKQNRKILNMLCR